MAVAVAVVGTGQRGMALAELVVRSPKFRLAAVCDVDEQRLAAAARRLGVEGERDHRRLAGRPDIQAVVVATGARWHAPVAEDLLAAGKHVYVEKPLADTPGAARRLAEAARAAGVVAVVGYQQRYTPFAATLAAELPAIRPVQGLLTAQRGPMNPQYFFPEPYGGIADFVTHTVDMALWAMGGRPEGVMAHVRRGTILGDRTLEFLEWLVDFDGGTRAVAIVSSMLGAGAANLIEFVGTRGTVWSTDRRTVQVVTHAGVTEAGARPPAGLATRTVSCPAEGDPTAAALDDFADLAAGAVRAGDRAWPRAATFEEGAQALAVAWAAVASAEQGRRVTLDEVLAGR
jgi:predicted dehydrogenase